MAKPGGAANFPAVPRAIFDAIEDAIMVLDSGFRVIDVNAACCKFLGRPRKDIIGKLCYRLMHSALRPPDTCPYKTVTRTKKRAAQEVYIKKGDKWLFISLDPVLDQNNKVSGAVHVLRDISERKRIEEALRESEERFYSLFNQASDSIFLMFPSKDDLIIIDANEAALRMHGYSRKELIGKPISSLDDKETARHVPGRLKVLLSGRKIIFAGRHKRKDATTFPVEVSAQLIKIRGKPYILAIDRDVTQREKAESALRKSEQEKAMVLNTIPEIVVHLDTNDRVLWANRAALDYAGVSLSRIIGKKCHKIWHGSNKPCAVCPPRIARKSGKPEESELRSDDGKAWAVKVCPLKDENGRVVSTVETVIDITERKKLENGLKHDKERLLRDLEEGRRLSDIGAFAATIAHELRNPLGVIRVAAYNIRTKTKDPSLYSHVDNIEKKIIASDNIINGILSYSRLKKPEYKKVGILNLLDECISYCRRKYLGYAVEIRKVYDCKKDASIMADPMHITALFSNILDNAFQALAGIGGRIEIRAGLSKDKKSLRMVFKDNGIGIDKEGLNSIFKPFFTTKERGVGLGLCVCREVVMFHGGDISVKSKKGRGTEVSITLPVSRK